MRAATAQIAAHSFLDLVAGQDQVGGEVGADMAWHAAAHLRGSVNVPADGRMAETVGMVLSPEQRVVLVAPEGREQEVATRFARIGFDHVLGHLADPEGYFLSHEDDVARASRLTVAEADEAFARDDVQVVDIRNVGELAAGGIPGAAHIPLAELARLHMLRHDHAAAVETAQRARTMAETLGDLEVTANAMVTIGTSRYLAGDLGGMVDQQAAVDLEGLAADQKIWTDRWDQLLQLGEVAPEG